MTIKQKMINEYEITLDSISNIYVVTVRKFGFADPIFHRVYLSNRGASRSYNNWCAKIDERNRKEIASNL